MKKKLVLTSETVRALTTPELAGIAGGAQITSTARHTQIVRQCVTQGICPTTTAIHTYFC